MPPIVGIYNNIGMKLWKVSSLRIVLSYLCNKIIKIVFFFV